MSTHSLPGHKILRALAEANSAPTPIQTLSFLTTNIVKLVFSSEQEQKSFGFFSRDLLSSVFAEPQPGVSAVCYLYFSFVTDELFSEPSCPCPREVWASHAVLKPAFSAPTWGERELRFQMAQGAMVGWRRQRERREGGGVWSAEVNKFEANYPWQPCSPPHTPMRGGG